MWGIESYFFYLLTYWMAPHCFRFWVLQVPSNLQHEPPAILYHHGSDQGETTLTSYLTWRLVFHYMQRLRGDQRMSSPRSYTTFWYPWCPRVTSHQRKTIPGRGLTLRFESRFMFTGVQYNMKRFIDLG